MSDHYYINRPVPFPGPLPEGPEEPYPPEYYTAQDPGAFQPFDGPLYLGEDPADYYPNPSPEERKAGHRLAKRLNRMKGQRPGTRWRYVASHNSIMKGTPTVRHHWETRKPEVYIKWGGFYSFEDAHSVLLKGGDWWQ